jgi:hypothetical protein
MLFCFCVFPYVGGCFSGVGWLYGLAGIVVNPKEQLKTKEGKHENQKELAHGIGVHDFGSNLHNRRNRR